MAKKLLVLACTLGFTLSACTQEATLPADALDPIKVGLILPFNGGGAQDGPPMENAAVLAAHEINAAGGPLPGRRLQLITKDSRTDTEVAKRAATELIDDGVVALIGAYSSARSLGVAEIAGPAKIPQISPSSTSPALNSPENAEKHAYFFRTVPPDDLQGWVVGSIAGGVYDTGLAAPCTRLAVAYLNDSYGTPFAQAIADRYRELEVGAVVAELPFQDELPSYANPNDTSEGANVVNDLLAQTPDCIALVAYAAGGIIVREWYDGGGSPDVVWIGGDAMKNDGFAGNAGPDVVGVLGTAPKTSPNTAQFRAFEKNYHNVFREAPGTFSAASFDAMALLGLAIAQAGSTEGEEIREALFDVSTRLNGGNETSFGPGNLVQALRAIRSGSTVDYYGAAGNVDFDENGDVVSDYEIWRVTDDSPLTFETTTVNANDIVL